MLTEEIQLTRGDVVYRHSTPHPYRVARIGWGDYAGEVRLVRFDEPLSDWRSGRWVPIGDVILLEIHDTLTTLKAIQPAFENRRLIDAGLKCDFRGWDEDGDLVMYVPGRGLETVLFVDMPSLSIC